MEGGSNVDGDESGGTSPSRQDAGTGILVPRNLVAMAAEIGIASGEKGSGIRVSATGEIYMRRGVTRGGEGAPGAPLGGQGWGRPGWPPGPPLAPLWPHFGFSRSFLYADFFCIFPGIFRALLIWGKSEIEKQQKTGTSTMVH